MSSGEVLMDFHEFSVSVPPCSFGRASGGLVEARREILCKERSVNPM